MGWRVISQEINIELDSLDIKELDDLDEAKKHDIENLEIQH